MGEVLDGKYRLERIIGEGAMGLVVEAMHLDLEQHVALKFLRREALERPDIVARFSREARAAAKIQSDHVARVFDVGGTKDGAPFIVMEFLQGNDLENIVLKSGPLEVSDAADYVIQACEGLAAAHAIGVVHRDIKPANLFLTEEDGPRQIKILDFGISKAGMGKATLDDVDTTGINTTNIMGSPHYMSPEQVRSTKDVDVRADIWSLGVVLYELLTGQTPFSATEVTGIILQVLYEPHRAVESFAPNVPPGVVAIIQRCLEKDPAARFQTAAELAAALVPFAPKRSRAVAERAAAVSSRGSGRPRADSLPPPTSGAPKVGRTTTSPVLVAATHAPAPARGKYVNVAIACAVLALAGVVVAKLTRSEPAPAASALAAPPSATAIANAEAAPPSPAADLTPPRSEPTSKASASAEPAPANPRAADAATTAKPRTKPTARPSSTAPGSPAPAKDDIFRER
jgi:serine/threonine-protein kinase